MFGYRPGSGAATTADLAIDQRDSAAGVPKSVVVDDGFDWGDDRPPETPWRQTIIYEAHVRGFTKLHPDVPEELRGTYAGLAHPAAIEHLHKLGVTAVELLPVHEFADDGFLEDRALRNYWGYSTLGFFAPEQRYASDAHAGRAGGRVQGDGQGAARRRHRGHPRRRLQPHLRGQPPGPDAEPARASTTPTYYWLMPEPRYYLDFTGTGNSLNASNPRGGAPDRRFAALLGARDARRRLPLRPGHHAGPGGRRASSARSAPIFQIISQDPVLSRVKLIAEPWDVRPRRLPGGQLPRAVRASGTASSATPCAATGRATRTWPPRSATG